MFCCGTKCCDSSMHTVFILGSKENKSLFFEKVLFLKFEPEAFTEIKFKYNSTPLLIQSCEVGDNLDEIKTLHSKTSCGIIYLSDKDIFLNFDSHSLFVLMNHKSKQISDGNLIITSVINDNWEECKEGFNKFVENLNKH